MDPLYERTHILLGDDGLMRLRQAHVLVAGLGGVGSFAAEALARAGIGQLTLVDHDTVAPTNLNRQLPALHTTIGRKKLAVMCERIAQINPACTLHPLDRFIRPEDMEELLAPRPDYVVDAIDSLNCKTALVEQAWRLGLGVVSSMGAGGKLDPTRLRVSDLQETEVCPLARNMRKRLKKRGVGQGVQVVWSDESSAPPLPPQPTDHGRDRAVNGTISYLPALFGLTLAGLVVNGLLGRTVGR